MKKYTFQHKQQVLFVTNAESHEEALQFAKDENAFEELDNLKLGFYDSEPKITVLVEELEVSEVTEEVTEDIPELANA